MKKSIITLSMILLTSLSVFAQGGDEKKETQYVFPKGWQGWYIDGAVTGSFFQSSDFSLSNFKIRGPFLGASAKIGKMFSPVLGFRIGYDYHPSKNHNEATVGYFSYKNLHADILFDVTNGVNGFKPSRVYRPILYLGTGLMGYDVGGGKIWIDGKSALEFGVDFGIMNCFRISNSLDLHLDLQSTLTRWSYDEFHTPYSYRVHSDWELMAGIIWYLGGRDFDACPECTESEADCSKQDAQIRILENELNELRNRPAASGNNQPCDTVVKFVERDGQLISTPFSIFFNKGSYELSSKKDVVNLTEIANTAKAQGYRIRLRGTCDNATGSKETNMKLAENRCNKVKEELVKLGVKENDIVVDAAGGVSELTPAELDRRVFVELIK